MKGVIKKWLLVLLLGFTFFPASKVNAEESSFYIENELTNSNNEQEETIATLNQINILYLDGSITLTGKFLPESQLILNWDERIIPFETEKDGYFKIVIDTQNKSDILVKIFNKDNLEIFHSDILLSDHINNFEQLNNNDTNQEFGNNNIQETSSMLKSASLMSDVTGTRYYIVKNGDTLSSIAKDFGVTENNLLRWNNLTKSTIVKDMVISVNGDNNYKNIFKGSRNFSSTQDMINQLAPIAKEVSGQYGIYPSVLMAQAILETGSGNSNLAILANNFFGIKGSYESNSIASLTNEEIKGVMKPVVQEFRLYPSLNASIYDYATRLRNGPTSDSSRPSWDPEFYKGTWIENTSSYKDATAWLSQKWATDSQYATKLNNIIESYSLYMYDDHLPIFSTENVNYAAQITKKWSINTKPWATKGYQQVKNSHLYYGSWVTVKQEKQTIKGTYALIELNGKEIGWIDTGALDKQRIINSKDTDYPALITKNWSISSLPWGIEGFKVISTSADYLGKTIKVIQEKDTLKSTCALIELDGHKIGWIDKDALNIHPVLDSRSTNYVAVVTKSWSINSKPWGTIGFQKVGDALSYLGQPVIVKEEKDTPRNTYALIELNGKQLGWIDTGALEKQVVLSTLDTDYKALVTKSWSINTLPWGVDGFKGLGNAAKFNGEVVRVIQEKITPKSTYALIEHKGQEIGWIDKDALNLYPILTTKDTNYMAKVTNGWSLNSKPWGTEGYKPLGTSNPYLNNWVLVKQEKATPKSVYGLIEYNGRELGWLDLDAMEPQKVISTKKVYYAGNILKGWSINSQPWGVKGFKSNGDASKLINQAVIVLEEKETLRSTYVLIEHKGKELGWIDKDALEIQTVLSTTDTNYVAKVAKSWSISTLPWGVDGFKVLSDSSKYLGKAVFIKQEKITPKSTYALIEFNNKELGWIDINALNKQRVLSNKQISYEGSVKRQESIYTKPFGVEGYEFVANSSQYLEKNIIIKQESETILGTYVLINLNGQDIGWIQKDALEIPQVVLATRNIKYGGVITKSWSINTLPWGVNGFKVVSSDGAYVGKTVEIIQEKDTPKGIYALVKVNGKELGWIDIGAIEKQRVLSTRNTNYKAVLSRAWSISTLPWGVEGYNVIGDGSLYLGDTVTVVQEKSTPRSIYALIEVNGKSLGWIDTGALEKLRVLSTKNTNYNARIIHGWSISSLPWGIDGSKVLRDASALVGRNITVTQEKVTPRSTYALISIGSQTLGWIDKNALKDSIVVYLDPGHGSSDTGAYYNGIAERDINLEVSNKIADRLRKAGFEVIMSRTTSQNTFSSNARDDLFARPNHANQVKADIFVSVHHNAMPGNSGIAGIETYYYGTETLYPPLPGNSNSHNDPVRLSNSRDLANSIHRELIGSTNANNRGVRTGAYVVVRETKMPAVLLELGYMSNPSELSKVTTNSYQNTLADAIVRGIVKYF